MFSQSQGVAMQNQSMSEIVILAVCFQLKQLKKQPGKNSGFNGIRTHYLTIDHLSMWLDSSVDRALTGIARSRVRVPFKPDFF